MQCERHTCTMPDSLLSGRHPNVTMQSLDLSLLSICPTPSSYLIHGSADVCHIGVFFIGHSYRLSYPENPSQSGRRQISFLHLWSSSMFYAPSVLYTYKSWFPFRFLLCSIALLIMKDAPRFRFSTLWHRQF